MESSAGNTRGLIEAAFSRLAVRPSSESSAGNTRGLIEAPVSKPRSAVPTAGLPRGIPAASLKLADRVDERVRLDVVFRGEYPRPH